MNLLKTFGQKTYLKTTHAISIHPNMIDIENEYSELSLFLKDHNVLVPDTKNKDLDVYEMIQLILEKNNPTTAFYIINLGEIIRQLKLWRELFPYISPKYAVKCNPNPVICQLLGLLGVGFDVASKNEINLVKEYVNDINNVVYANPHKEWSSIQYARSTDVDYAVFDSEYELQKIKLFHPKCKLLMRLKVNDKNSLCRFSTKFGVDIKHAQSLLTCATNLKLKVVGVSFHVGSGCRDAAQYYEALQMCRQVFDLAATPLEIIDIGGGFPGLHDPDSLTLLKNISIQLNKGFTELFLSDYHIVDFEAPNNNPDLPPIQVISEPGRFFVQSSHTLLVNVISKNVFETSEKTSTYYYYLNDGVYGSFNCIFFDNQKPEILPYNERDGEKYPSTVFGPTCDSIDKICEAIELPELEIGEWCFVKNFGAYTTAAASNFNGFSKTPAFYVLN